VAVWVVPLNLVVQVGVPLPFQASPHARATKAQARGVLTAGWKELPLKDCWLKTFHPITHPAGVRSAAMIGRGGRARQQGGSGMAALVAALRSAIRCPRRGGASLGAHWSWPVKRTQPRLRCHAR